MDEKENEAASRMKGEENKKKREKMERTGTFSIFSSTICNLGVGRDFAGAGKVTNDPNP